VSGAYSLSPRRARIVRLAAGLFLLMGLVGTVAMFGAMIQPGMAFHCDAQGCSSEAQIIELAPEDARAALSASPAAEEGFERHVAWPLVRAGLAAVELIRGLPFVALMLGVGLALRELSTRRANALARALPWLRRASLAAILMALAGPVAASAQAMILYPGTPAGPMWSIEADVRSFALELLLALAAFAVAWALDAGSRAERDMAAIV
jgi:hypothetical protein